MNSLDQYQMRTHVTILGWLFIVGQAVILLIAAFVFILLVGIGVATQDRTAMPILSTVAIVVAGLLVVLAVPGLVAGFGLLARKPWARILALVVAVLGIFNFPVGTLIAVYSFYVLLQQDADQYFRSAPPPDMIPTTHTPV